MENFKNFNNFIIYRITARLSISIRGTVVVQKKMIQRFAFKHRPQTFSCVCLRLKRRVCQFKRRVCRWKRECYRSANAAAILGVTVMF